ncbi:MAG: glucose 1-dehydrogenase [Candidatus Rokubacteria bacterium]|nr:glucose 1-dehydrogenase [Candidatus Rokubacteria bacterium]
MATRGRTRRGDGAGLGPRLKGKVAFITGAGRGMGREGALLFAGHGAKIVVADIDRAAAAETVALIKEEGGVALATIGDVAAEADVKRMIAEGVRAFGALHILYNNAGVLWKDRDRSVTETEEASWDRVIAINLKSVFLVAKHGIPHLRKAGGGSIINVGSVSALAGFTRAQDAYTSAKGALISLTKSLAIQFAKDGIRCNIIHPGIVDTPMQAPHLTAALRREFEASIPLGRIAHPREIACAALFLASEESSFMTGAELVVDGGFTAQ